MKARIKHTQQIIDVEWDIRGWIWDGPKGKRIFDTEELAFFDSDNIDWQSFRAEAAKEFTAALLSVIDWEHTYNENIIKQAIDLADELIKQLKEKEE